jgi:ribonuclease J
MDNKPNNNRPPRRGSNNDRPSGGNRGNKPAPGNGSRSGASRGAAIRAQRRSQEDAQKIANQYAAAVPEIAKPDQRGRANTLVEEADRLKITFLGGLEDVGEKNMAVIEYKNDAIILDTGNSLGIDLPGINYAIADPTYLEGIRHKIRGYVITHGHLDHVGGLRHIVPKFAAPIYGSRFTIGIVEKTFEDAIAESGLNFKPELVIMNMDNHERLKLGEFTIELLRITHSIPEASSAVIDSPVGRIIATGDFRLDPEPLDQLPSDTNRLKELGDEGVLILLSESSYADSEGRTPTEHTLQQSYHDVIAQSHGRIFVAIFSSNMNRIQMVVNAAAAAGRKIALDGRSMMSYAEIAVRQGILKVPKGTFIAMKDVSSVPDSQLLVMCTGGQGEPGAALRRMADGDHKYVKLKEGDTVVISSSPIPGNEIRYDEISNNLSMRGVHLFRHPTHELDGCGPLHVSGHARREEMRDMLKFTRPKFVIPVHAGALRRKYHAELAIEEGWPRNNVLVLKNGDTVSFTKDNYEIGEPVPHGSLLVDQTGSVVNNVVVKDRVLLSEEGLVSIVLTIDKKSGNLLTSPDIISRGFIYMRDNEELMNDLRQELRRAVQQRFNRIELDRFKAELKDHVTHFLFEKTQRSPIVIPVVNIIGGKVEAKTVHANKQPQSAEDVAAEQQRRFQEMRARLLGQDQPD